MYVIKLETQKEELPPHLKLSNKEILTDYYFFLNEKEKEKRIVEDGSDKYKYKIFIRLYSNEIRFKNVSFEHCVFDGCYLKRCIFDNCNFTGCKFISCNFHLCAFTGCCFKYAIFERTQIDIDILSEAPLEENLHMRFARSLRMNYQQIGDAKAVNKAIEKELNATAIYLHKSWSSNEAYYVKKYSGLKRIPQFLKWSEFWLMNFIWGNGESAFKLLRLAFLVVVLISIIDTIVYHDANSINDYWHGFKHSSAVFFGFNIPPTYPELYTGLIAFTRLTLFALFTAILVKRFNRR